MNYFGILFAIETGLLFADLVPVNMTTMIFYVVTFCSAVVMWSEKTRDKRS